MIPVITQKSRAVGSGQGINVVIEPSTSPGYSFLGMINYRTSEAVWTHRAIRIYLLFDTLKIMAPEAVDLEWSVSETETTVSKSMFSDGRESTRHRSLFA